MSRPVVPHPTRSTRAGPGTAHAAVGIGAFAAALALFWGAPPVLQAQERQAVPELRARVTDLTGTLSGSRQAALEAKLSDFEGATGTQIAVLLVPTARPEAIEQYALRVVEAWRLGRAGVDDGALLLVALDDREVRIEVGYGLEGALNDATSRRIIDEAILPHFRTGDLYGGLAAGVDRMIAVAEGEELPPPAERPVSGPEGVIPLLPVVVVAALALAAVLTPLFGRLLGATATGGVTGVVTLLLAGSLGAALMVAGLAFLLALLVGPTARWSSHRRYGGRFPGGFGGGGFGGRGGGFGGGGGGFGGGGGGFGGGGASGSW